MADDIESKNRVILNSNPHPRTCEEMKTVLSAFNELGQYGVGASPHVHNRIQNKLSAYLSGLTQDERIKFGQAYESGTESHPVPLLATVFGSAIPVAWLRELPGATVHMNDNKLQYIEFDKSFASNNYPSAESYRVEVPLS